MSQRITRRALGLSAAAAALAQETPASSYRGPLDNFESKVDLAAFDSLAWSRKLYERAPLRMTFRAQSRKQADAWQKQLRAKVVELIGGLPDRGPAPKTQMLETRDFGNYKREKFVFESRPGSLVLAYLLSPKSAGPHPVMICIPGHGRGVDDIVGIDDKGRDRTDKSGYQRDFAIQFAESGVAALAMEPMGFGCRRDAAARKRNLGQSSCQPAAGAALLLGETMIAWRVFDVMRAIDWVATRDDLDAKRVGCGGISGGGTCTIFAAAVDPRIQLAYLSCSLNTFRDSIFSISHCIDNYVPGLLNWAEMYDLAGLIAPRAFFAESGERDPIFPVDGAKESFARIRKIYEMFGAVAQVRHEVFDGEHVFSGRHGIPFTAEKLRARG